ncbi:hypothetical protein C7N83_06815 [Neisseria iguanae]|uniref:Uncharacterized protein n=1 Tax=Neisseria iguanae TaxID=90242 RepID=A0A2P7U0A6_9NEIS|nr:hypothetical protein C7N83_06815 [Neisseria iguanae]
MNRVGMLVRVRVLILSALPIFKQKSADARRYSKRRFTSRHSKVGHLAHIFNTADGFYAEKMPHDKMKTRPRKAVGKNNGQPTSKTETVSDGPKYSQSS